MNSIKSRMMRPSISKNIRYNNASIVSNSTSSISKRPPVAAIERVKRQYKDICIFTIIKHLQTKEDVDGIKNFVGSYHSYRETLEVPTIYIFTETLIKDIPIEYIEELDWWKSVYLVNIQTALQLPQRALPDTINERLLRLSLMRVLLIDRNHDHCFWFSNLYVFEPERNNMFSARNPYNKQALLNATKLGRTYITLLSSTLELRGHLQLTSPASQDPNAIIAEGYNRKMGLLILLKELTSSRLDQNVEKFKIDKSQILNAPEGHFTLLEKSWGSSCVVQIKEESFENVLLLPAVIESPITDIFKTVSEKKGSKRLAIAMPTTSKGSKEDEEAVFLRVFFPSLIKTLSEEEWSKFTVTVYIGFDHGDKYFESAKQLQAIMDSFVKMFKDRPIQLKMYRLPKIQRVSQLWNLLSAHIIKDGFDYLYQVNDDLTLITPGWLTRFSTDLDSHKGFGVFGPSDQYFNLGCSVLTQTMVTPVHFEIFGFLYPSYFRDWESDRWITDVYKPTNSYCTAEYQVKNGGVAARYDHCEPFHYWIYLDEGYRKIEEWKRMKNYNKL